MLLFRLSLIYGPIITQNNQNKKLSQRYVMVWNNNVNMDLFNAPTPFGDEVAKT